MAETVYQVEGGRQLRKSLRDAGDNLTDLKIVHGQAAAVAARRVEARAPRRSGRLAATIRGAGTKTAGIVRAGNNSKVPYAPVIQWGWGRRHIKANPFATLGAQESESTWLPLYERYVETTINTIKGK